MMHCGKNLAVNLIKIVFDEKESRKVYFDLQVLGVRESLWLKPHPSQNGEFQQLLG